MLDLAHYYKKLADGSAIAEDEIVALLKEVAHFRVVAAHLAVCQAATTSALPASTSKSTRRRHEVICSTAARALAGDLAAIRYPGSVEDAIADCAAAGGAAAA